METPDGPLPAAGSTDARSATPLSRGGQRGDQGFPRYNWKGLNGFGLVETITLFVSR
jgi:hypothetical protein